MTTANAADTLTCNNGPLSAQESALLSAALNDLLAARLPAGLGAPLEQLERLASLQAVVLQQLMRLSAISYLVVQATTSNGQETSALRALQEMVSAALIRDVPTYAAELERTGSVQVKTAPVQ